MAEQRRGVGSRSEPTAEVAPRSPRPRAFADAGGALVADSAHGQAAITCATAAVSFLP